MVYVIGMYNPISACKIFLLHGLTAWSLCASYELKKYAGDALTAFVTFVIYQYYSYTLNPSFKNLGYSGQQLPSCSFREDWMF